MADVASAFKDWSEIAANNGPGGTATVGSGLDDNLRQIQATIKKSFGHIVSVKDYGAVGDGVVNDTSAIQSAIDAVGVNGGTVVFPPGTYLLSAEVTVAFDDVVLDGHAATLSTASNISMLRFGAGSASSSVYRGCGLKGQWIIEGAGAGSDNTGLTIRNVSYGNFNCDLKITNCAGTPFVFASYQRGVQHNFVGGGWSITGNPGGAWDINANDTGAYINDNTFQAIRSYENGSGGIVHARMRGQVIENNTFVSVSVETTDATDTLLDMDTGEANSFLGLRLDGESGTTALNIASGCNGNVFIAPSFDGSIIDASDSSVVISDQGASDLPFIRLGDVSGVANSWDIKIAIPSSVKELHIAYNDASDGIVRFPANTEVFFGNRSGGDAGPIEIIGEDKQVRLRTLPDTTIANSPKILFEGEFASGGSAGNCDLRQDANGVKFEFSASGKMLHSSQSISILDGATAPSTIAGRAIIYVDTADGDLKVKFGDGVVKTLATDT